MSDPVAAYLSGLRLGVPQTRENLTLIPLLAAAEAPVEYLTLDDALRDRLVEITEISEGGAVQTLKVLNRSRSKVLILDGEALVGAKQNRISNASFVIPGESERMIPVSCIEEGRWRWSSRSFGTSDSMYALFGRRAKLKDTTSMLRTSNQFASDQGKVWDTVKDYLGAGGARSATGSYVDLHEHRHADLDAYLSAFAPDPDQVGVMVVINGRLQGLDAFGKKVTWRKVFPKLVRSYAMDAIVRTTVEPASGAGADVEPGAFLRDVASAPRESFESVGEGTDYRMETDSVIASALVLDASLLHLTAFPKAAPVPGPPTGAPVS